MKADTHSELERFQSFVVEKLSNGNSDLTPEQVLDLWRIENPTTDEHAANVEAIREAVADMEAGDHGRPYKEVLDEIRERLRL